MNFTITESFNIANILWFLVLGILSGLLSLNFSKMTLFIESKYEKIKNIFLRLAIGGIVLGGLIYLFPPFYGEGYDLLIPLIITSTVIYITTRSFERHSIYHVQLAERGELITHGKDKAVLTFMDWKVAIEKDLLKIKATDTLGDLIKIIAKSKRNLFPVVDEYNILEGVVSLDNVREIMYNHELFETTLVKDLMTIPPSYIDKKENIETVMEAFRKTGAWNLPVLDNGYYVGFISKSRIYTTYRELLIQLSEE